MGGFETRPNVGTPLRCAKGAVRLLDGFEGVFGFAGFDSAESLGGDIA